MKTRQLFIVVLGVCLAACVTVNVYFPESAAERAADVFVKDVYGSDDPDVQNPSAPTGGAPTGAIEVPVSTLIALWSDIGQIVLPVAHAQQPDINISTPAINVLRSAMAQRHRQLKPYYRSGAVGMSATGLIILRDPKVVPLKQRNVVKKLVADENADRNRLYGEIAKANAHPEWKKDIRGIFAERWVGNAPQGWWYNSGGKWQQK